MRHPGGQAPDRSQLFGLDQLGVRLLQLARALLHHALQPVGMGALGALELLFGAAQWGDVEDHGQHLTGSAVFLVKRRGRNQDMERGAVFVEYARLVGVAQSS